MHLASRWVWDRASPTLNRVHRPARLFGRRPRSHLHDFGFFLLRELFHAPDFAVGHLLDLFHGALLFVLADLLVLGELLEGVIAVAANVADRGAVLFEHFVEVLADIAAALLGHGR